LKSRLDIFAIFATSKSDIPQLCFLPWDIGFDRRKRGDRGKVIVIPITFYQNSSDLEMPRAGYAF